MWVHTFWESFMYVNKRYRSIIFFPGSIFVRFWYWCNAGCLEWVNKYSSCFRLLKEIIDNWHNLFLNYLMEFTLNPSISGIFCFGKLVLIPLNIYIYIYRSIEIICFFLCGFFLLLVWILCEVSDCVCQWIGSFHLGYEM